MIGVESLQPDGQTIRSATESERRSTEYRSATKGCKEKKKALLCHLRFDIRFAF